MSYAIREITINNEFHPLGMDIEKPLIAWRFEADGPLKQKKLRIQVGTQPSANDYWDTGILESSHSIGMQYDGAPLQPETRYYVTVETWNQQGEYARAETWFETGLLNSSIEAWNGAKWIGAPEYYVSAPNISVFTLISTLRIHEGGRRAGIVFGANDARLLNKERNEMLIEGENYIRYVLNVEPQQAELEIWRVGYAPNDTDEKPWAVVTVSGITAENRYEPHELKIQVIGNCANTYIDGVQVDTKRQLNALGSNDITTFPRLCEIGYYTAAGTTTEFDGLTVRNNRTPEAVIRQLDAVTIHAESTDYQKTEDPSIHSLPMLRRDYNVKEGLKQARLYATARGIYEAMINGHRVGEQYFAPGASQYDHHLMYQTYDVTAMLQSGKNGIGFTLSSGWWNDMSTYVLRNYNYWGDKPSLLAMLQLTYDDGTTETVVTDCDNWQYYGEGPFIYSGFFNGEWYDASRTWIYEEYSKAGFTIDGMKKPIEIDTVPIKGNPSPWPAAPDWPDLNDQEPEIVGSDNAPVYAVETLTAVQAFSPATGVYVYDLEQEIAGIPSIVLHGKPGSEIRIRYGEILYPMLEEYGELAGRMLQVNLREASNTDVIIMGKEEEIFCPKFTFHGFRYIEITGTNTPPAIEEVQAIVLSSVTEITGHFECENPLVNRLVKNVRYSMLSNYISIPTDCPQRNERMGWAGDTHIFTRTATYQASVKNFLRRNLQAMKDLQTPEGRYPQVAPMGGGFGGITYESATILMTWELYQQYGDITIIEENYPAMKCWMDSMERIGMPGDAEVGPLGDWLAVDETDLHLIWNAFYIRDAKYMKRFAEILGIDEDVHRYTKIEQYAREYWNARYVNYEGRTLCSDGSLCDTQGSYSIGLNCYAFADEILAAGYLFEKTKEAGYTVHTGFFGTGPLNPLLTSFGYEEAAYKMITQTEYPSWLYPVTQGATTIWERWNGYTEKDGFGGNNAMNSFNHYSFGSVLNWCYEYVLGIQRDEQYPGYEHYVLKPVIYGFEKAEGGIDIPAGRIESGWVRTDTGVQYHCTVAPNTTATLILGEQVCELESGIYKISVDYKCI